MDCGTTNCYNRDRDSYPCPHGYIRSALTNWVNSPMPHTLLGEIPKFPFSLVMKSDFHWSCRTFRNQNPHLTEECFKPEKLSRIAQITTAALIDKAETSLILASVLLSAPRNGSLVTSIFWYACESLTLIAELQRRIKIFEIRIISNIIFCNDILHKMCNILCKILHI